MESIEEQIEYGDYCQPHGNPVGTPGGADIMCQLCEMGMNTWIEDPEYKLQMGMVKDRIVDPTAELLGIEAYLDDDDPAERWYGVSIGGSIRESQLHSPNRTLVKLLRQLRKLSEQIPYRGYAWWMQQVNSGYWVE